MQAFRTVWRARLNVSLALGLSLATTLVTFVRVPSAMTTATVRPTPAPDEVAAVAVTPSEARRRNHGRTDAVVLVVVDGVRWQEALVSTDPRFATNDDRGVLAPSLMPNLHAMAAAGAVVGAPGHGPPMLASGPNFVSLPGYTEIFGGHPPVACADNDCPATRLPTIVDEVRARTSDVAVFASWAPIERAAARNLADILTSTGEPVTRAFRSDRVTADLALDYLVARRPTLLFLGLGEPDEFAHRGDYAGYLRALRQVDAVLGELRQRLASTGSWGERVSVFVTCDHGRSFDFRDHGAPWPDSSRVFLVASGGAIPSRGDVDSTSSRHLSDIAPTVRALLDLTPDRSTAAGAAIAELLPTP